MSLFKNTLKVFTLAFLALYVFMVLCKSCFSEKEGNKNDKDNMEIEEKLQ